MAEPIHSLRRENSARSGERSDRRRMEALRTEKDAAESHGNKVAAESETGEVAHRGNSTRSLKVARLSWRPRRERKRRIGQQLAKISLIWQHGGIVPEGEVA